MLTIWVRKNLSRIVIVVGYEEKKLIEYINLPSIGTKVCYISNRDYAKTNNIYSLALAKEYLELEDTLLLDSDIIFEESLIDKLLYDERAMLALVDKFERLDRCCMHGT